MNKEKVTKEYKRRVCKIWTSELYSGNKITAHNTFAVAQTMPAIGILNWTRKEIEDLDKATRQIICYTSNLHMRSNINRIYVPRKQGGRGLASIEDTFAPRIVALANHIEAAATSNPFLEKVKEHEQNNIIRLRDQLLQYHDIEPEKYTKSARNTKLKCDHLEAWKNKPLHSYIFKKIEDDNEIGKPASHQWLHSGISSHVEGYINGMQDQEIATKATRKWREKDPTINAKCRLCGSQDETVLHALGSCPSLSSNLYMTARHENVGRHIVEEIVKQEKQLTYRKRPESVTVIKNKEIWWNMSIKTANKVEYNRPDAVIWNKETKVCHLVEISVPLDINTSNRQVVKRDKYMLLVSEMQQLYRNYTFQIIPVIIGCLGAIPKSLEQNLKKLGLEDATYKSLIEKLQKTALPGSVMIMKTFIRM